MTDVTNPTVSNRRAVFVNNFRSMDDPHQDLTVVKEKVLLSDGREVPKLVLKPNVQRPFWVEKKHTQVYKDKKETRPLDALDEIWCTQSELASKVARVVGHRGEWIPGIRKLAQSPYLYGLDCDVTVHVKRSTDLDYHRTYGDYTPVLSMGVLDYETNMFSEEEEIIMGAVTMKDKWLCAVDKNWLNKRIGVAEGLDDALEKYLGEMAKERGVDLKEAVILVDSEIEVVQALFERLHELKPDICSIWNMEFDIEKTIAACARAGVDPADIFCDPDIPLEYRTFNWIPDNGNKQKADGSSSTKDISDKWHWVQAPCSFQFIDNMCAFRMFRAMEQKMGSYSLDAVLERVFGGKLRKMKFEEASHIPSNTPEWHKFMQKNFPLEYICYNIFDCVVMELLDEEEKDISHKLYSYVGISNYRKAKSNPTRLADSYAMFLGEKFGRALCSTSNKMKHVFDDLTLKKTDWIVTLSNDLNLPKDIGYNPFNSSNERTEKNEMYEIFTKCAAMVFDIDISSSYPSNELALNISRDTTLVEVCQVEGITELEHREVCIDLINAKGNASKICETVLKFPTHDELFEKFMEEEAKVA